MNIDGKDVKLTPGMAATVEIKTEKRKLIEFLLSPLMRMTDEAGREMRVLEAMHQTARSLRCLAAVTAMIVLAAPLSAGAAFGDDDPRSYGAITKIGRPANLYQGVEAKEPEVCEAILAALNRPFPAPATAVDDKEYLLHTGYEVALKPVPSRTQFASIDDALEIVEGQPAEKRDPLILLFSSQIGGSPREKLILVAPAFLNLDAPIPVEQVRELIGTDKPRLHAFVRTGKWRETQNLLEGSSSQSLYFIQSDYVAIPLRVAGRYFGLVSSPEMFGSDGRITRDLVVLVFNLDWQTLSNPLCVFKLAA
jgi:hypothetical protein